MISVTELRSGTVFEDRGQFFLVLSYEHIKMGRGSGNVKVKVKDLASGAIVLRSFITGARVNEANLSRIKVQYLYGGGGSYHFMNLENYEQFELGQEIVGEADRYLKEGMETLLFAVGDKSLYIEIPKIVLYKVAQTGGAVRGNTVGASFKDAVLENGLSVKVPLFIKQGEVIKINTESCEYVGRS